MTTALARVSGSGDVAGPLPSLKDAQAQVVVLVADGAAGILDEARRQAEAHALYEKRTTSQERANHYSKMRLLAEAGLGVLSFDDPAVVKKSFQRTAYRALAAALERGRLLDLCEGRSGIGWHQTLGTERMAGVVRDHGLTHVPGEALDTRGSVPWVVARVLARDLGIAPSTLPTDDGPSRRRVAAARAQSDRMHALYRAAERERRAKLTKDLIKAANSRGPRTDIAYGLLRRALQALDASLQESTGEDREWLESAMEQMYEAEERVGKALRLIPPDENGLQRRREFGI